MKKLINKLGNIFLIMLMLFSSFSPYIVNAEEPSKGDLRLGNTTGDSVTVTTGSFNNPGDVEIQKIVSKTDTDGKYKIEFKVHGKPTTSTITKPVYVVVVLDQSLSMNYTNNNKTYKPEKWTSATNGAKTFAQSLISSIPDANLALVKFSGNTNEKCLEESGKGQNKTCTKYEEDDATIVRGFANSNFNSVNFGSPTGYTNMEAGLKSAKSLLDDVKVTDALKIVVLLSDGLPTLYYDTNGKTMGNGTNTGSIYNQPAYNMATSIKDSGATIYAIGYYVGDNEKAILTNITGSTERYFAADDASKVAAAFTDIAKKINTQYSTNANLKDNLGSDFSLSNGSTTLTLDKITEEWQSMGSFNITIDPDTKTGWHPTNDGFKLTYLDKDKNQKTITCDENPEVYWVQNTYDYRIEYYYDKVIDNSLTTKGKDVKDAIISVTDEMINTNLKTGYDYVSTEPSKTITIKNKGENVIKVYYEKQTLKYNIEHYIEDSNGTITNDGKTYSLKETEADKTIKYGETATYSNKTYDGYTYISSKTTPDNLVVTNNDLVIKLFYDKADYAYKIEYYYDNTIDSSKTVSEEAKFKDTITVTEEMINNNLKDGYKYVNSNPENNSIAIQSDASKNIIKVYYERDNFEYTIEYYYDNKIDSSKTVSEEALFNETITVTDTMINNNLKDGYKYVNSNPTSKEITIASDSSKNIIKVYYEKDNFEYTINYHYEDITEVTSETNKAEFEETITISQTMIDEHNKTGYKYDHTTPESIIITSDKTKNVIDVYYVKEDYQYTVEYYQQNVNKDGYTKVDADTATKTGKFGAKAIYDINTYDGFTYNSAQTINGNTTIPANNNLVIKLYYNRDNYSYKVEHYLEQLDGKYALETTDTYNDQTFGDNATYELNTYPNHTFNNDKTENGNATVPANNDLVIELYYDLKLCTYDVEYYYDNKLNDTKTDSFKDIKLGTTINTYKDKVITGYHFVKDENKPLTVKENGENIIKVYYEKSDYAYSIEYYYDGIIDNTKTDTFTAKFNDTINGYKDKNIDGYKLDKVENDPLTVTEIAENNVMKVYYVKDNFEYTIEYYYDNQIDDTLTVTDEALFNETITVTQDMITDNTKEGYTFDSVDPTSKEIIITSDKEKNIIKVYYVHINYSYKVEHYLEQLDGTYTLDDTDTYENQIFGNDATYELNDYDDYTNNSDKTINDNATVPSNNDLVIELYYDINDSKVTVKYVILDPDTLEYIPFSEYGADENGNPSEVFAGLDVNDAITIDKIGKTVDMSGRKPTDYNFIGLYSGSDMSTLISSKDESYSTTITSEEQVYTYVYQPPYGGPPQTGEVNNFIVLYGIIATMFSVLFQYSKTRKDND